MGPEQDQTEIAVAEAVLQRDKTLAVLAVDISRAADELDLADIAKPNIGGRRLGIRVCTRYRNRANGVDVLAVFRCQADGQRGEPLPLRDPRNFSAAGRRP